MKRLSLILSAALFVSSLLATSVSAEVPHLIRFQGKVTDKGGAPLNGEYNITFRIYNAETGVELKWSETQSAVRVDNGIFTALLGSVTPFGKDLTFDEPYWLSLEVNNDGEMEPRQRITSVGYALRAEVAESVAGVSIIPQGAIILWRGTSCPEGYSPVNDLQGKFLVARAEGEPETTGGSNTHTHTGPSHTHTAPSSNYEVDRVSGGSSNPHTKFQASGGDATAWLFANRFSTSAAGTGATGPADSRPEFATIILCEKE